MERPTPPARRPPTPAGDRPVPDQGPVGDGSVVRLSRPDGRLQVGLGPHAWVVQGWSPATGAAASLVQALAGGGPCPAARECAALPCHVLGHGELACALRQRLAPPAAPGAADGVVVLVSAYAVPVGSARRADLVATPVLPVVAQTARVVVGPWTGLATGPCLHCLDLHRTDADPAWPALAAALDDPATCPPPPRHGADVVALVSALTVLLVRGLVRDGRVEQGLAYEVGDRRPHLVLRRWPTHPACPWHPVGPDATDGQGQW